MRRPLLGSLLRIVAQGGHRMGDQLFELCHHIRILCGEIRLLLQVICQLYQFAPASLACLFRGRPVGVGLFQVEMEFPVAPPDGLELAAPIVVENFGGRPGFLRGEEEIANVVTIDLFSGE